MMEALSSSETSVLTRAPRRNISEDGILHSHSRENLKSYILNEVLTTKKRHAETLPLDIGSVSFLLVSDMIIYLEARIRRAGMHPSAVPNRKATP
jgi:hypothetical protein